jgi:hypothetical protein
MIVTLQASFLSCNIEYNKSYDGAQVILKICGLFPSNLKHMPGYSKNRLNGIYRGKGPISKSRETVSPLNRFLLTNLRKTLHTTEMSALGGRVR